MLIPRYLQNVLLTRDNPPIVKVADFGLAKFVDSLTMLRVRVEATISRYISLRFLQTMCGTPSYLAPEVVRQENNEGYDNVVDSWSVGVIVFSMYAIPAPSLRMRTRGISALVSRNALSIGIVAALQHPWLTSYIPVYDHSAIITTSSIPADDYSMLESDPDNDSGFHSSVNAGFQNLQIQPPAGSSTPPIPGAFPNGSVAPGVKRDGSRTAPLQRGSHLLLQAAEEGKPIPEPSWEMIAHAAEQEQKEHQQHAAGPSNWNAKGQNKRVHSELTPLSEEASLDAVINGANPSDDAGAPADQEGSGSDDDLFKPSTTTTGKASRGKSKAAALPVKKSTRARAAKGAAQSEDETVQPRRSSRHPQKLARHA